MESLISQLKSQGGKQILIVFGILGLLVFLYALGKQQNLFGRAAEPDKLEIEGGVLSSTGVQKLTDFLASGGEYVLFANPSNPPTPTPTPPIPTGSGRQFFVSTSGSDTNSGTISTPFKTIQKAVSLAQAGDTIFIRGGTYIVSSVAQTTTPGTSQKPIFIKPYNNEIVIVDGNNYAIERFINIDHEYWVLEGFELSYFIQAINIHSNNNTVRNMLIHHIDRPGSTVTSIGIKIDEPATDNCDSNVITGNEIHTVDGEAVYIGQAPPKSGESFCEGNQVIDNYFHDIHEGMDIKRDSHNNIIKNNRIDKCTGWGIAYEPPNDVSGNIITNCQDAIHVYN